MNAGSFGLVCWVTLLIQGHTSAKTYWMPIVLYLKGISEWFERDDALPHRIFARNIFK